MHLLLLAVLLAVAGVSNGQRGRGKGDSADNFPPYYRVEVEIIKFSNPGSVDLSNHWCDSTSKCDTGISAYLDLDKPLKPFESAAKAKVVFTSTDNDSPTVNAIVNHDVCGGASSQVTLRAYIYDTDVGGIWQTIDDIDCKFIINPSDVASDAKNAKWGPTTTCQAKYRNSDHVLTAHIRAFKTDEATCHVDHAQLMQLQSDSSKSSSKPKPHVPGEHEIINLELQLVQLNNPNGKTYKGDFCDVASPCDPFFMAKLDTENSLWKWPGIDGDNGYKQVGNFWDNNSPQLNQKMHRTICGGALNWVNLRVEVKDGDPTALLHYTLIESFQCVFQFDYGTVAPSESSSEWGPTMDCTPNHPGHDIRLQYRVRAYDSELSSC
ncbi:uncharacterized protein LOC129592300 isoform X2 [Paramacrobiotus metropolitanus]|uniref:uncharacterized protein LOC129592300 isoform X2 n=1 Tax=Paramacrobiotus metropolitanus TaxID=2943436 RepID=UPI002445C77A|nr:uncharacterized protein LOC129592300 isoform X2 [Paramacrobiotus metropolitanus]